MPGTSDRAGLRIGKLSRAANVHIETIRYYERCESENRGGHKVLIGPIAQRRRRDGFALTDRRHGERHVLYEIDHCIYCHDRDTDSCSKGMRNRKDGSYKVNPLGVNITGCPLEEKISEMHLVKRQGDNIGALALIVIDNPMCPGTGHRICNDCMKGCIYQKTQPVDIPQIETSVLTDVLVHAVWVRDLQPADALESPERAPSVCVAVSRHECRWSWASGRRVTRWRIIFLNEGFGVVGIDALKIEPLPAELIGDGEHPPKPIRISKSSTTISTSACSPASAALPSTALRSAGTRIS